jgi:phosphatidylserine/phosphatidylglycerophosphate/cardiolipin synthase-like enzyme
VRELVQMRLHTRTILRDRERAFIGSQSLRDIELEKRREVGVILQDQKVVHRLQEVFAEDWSLAKEYGLEGGTGKTRLTLEGRLAHSESRCVRRNR